MAGCRYVVVGVLLVLTWRLDLSTAQEDRAGGEGLTGKAGNATQTTNCSNVEDFEERCITWALIGECQRNKEFLGLNCRRSCGLCSNATLREQPMPSNSTGNTTITAPAEGNGTRNVTRTEPGVVQSNVSTTEAAPTPVLGTGEGTHGTPTMFSQGPANVTTTTMASPLGETPTNVTGIEVQNTTQPASMSSAQSSPTTTISPVEGMSIKPITNPQVSNETNSTLAESERLKSSTGVPANAITQEPAVIASVSESGPSNILPIADVSMSTTTTSEGSTEAEEALIQTVKPEPLANVTSNETSAPSTAQQNVTIISAMNATAMPSMIVTFVPAMNVTDMPAMNGTDMPAMNGTSMPAMNATAIPAMNGTSMHAMNATAIPAMHGTSMPAMNATAIPAMNGTSMHAMNATATPAMNGTGMPTMSITAMPAMNATSIRAMNATDMPAMNGTAMPLMTTKETAETPIDVIPLSSTTSSTRSSTLHVDVTKSPSPSSPVSINATMLTTTAEQGLLVSNGITMNRSTSTPPIFKTDMVNTTVAVEGISPTSSTENTTKLPTPLESESSSSPVTAPSTPGNSTAQEGMTTFPNKSGTPRPATPELPQLNSSTSAALSSTTSTVTPVVSGENTTTMIGTPQGSSTMSKVSNQTTMEGNQSITVMIQSTSSSQLPSTVRPKIPLLNTTTMPNMSTMSTSDVTARNTSADGTSTMLPIKSMPSTSNTTTASNSTSTVPTSSTTIVSITSSSVPSSPTPSISTTTIAPTTTTTKVVTVVVPSSTPIVATETTLPMSTLSGSGKTDTGTSSPKTEMKTSTSSMAQPTTKVPCMNVWNDKDCEYWKSTGECTSNLDWMIKNCYKTCHNCTVSTTPLCSNVVDTDTLCPTWADDGECSRNPVWMNNNCAWSCNCKDDVGITTGTTSIKNTSVPTTQTVPSSPHQTVSTAMQSTLSTTIKPEALNTTTELLISNETHILRYDGHTVTSLYAEERSSIVGLAVDVDRGLVFWSDLGWGRKGIYRATLQGENITRIISEDVLEVNGLTLDYASGHVYWTDSQRRRIEMADYDGGNRRVVVNTGLQAPRGVLADPLHGYLFWGDQGTRSIERSLLDGTERKRVVDQNLVWPNQLALVDNRLLFVDGWNKTLSSVGLDGEDVTLVASLSDLTGDNPVYGLTVVNDTAYVSVWGSGSVVRVPMEEGAASPTTILDGLSRDVMFSMASTDPASQPAGLNPCSWSDRGGCSHLCLPTGVFTYRCACPSMGGKVARGGECVVPETVLLYADADLGEVRFTDPASDSGEQYVVGSSSRPVAVGYDPLTQTVFWSDVQERSIHKAYLNGTGHTVLLNASQGLGFVDGLYVDFLHRKLYFTNADFVTIDGTAFTWHRVEVVGLDGTGRRSVITDVEQPRGLWVDMEAGFLYYTDWGRDARLLRSRLDGSEREVIRDGLENPNDVSMSGDAVYVIDSHAKGREAGREGARGALYRFWREKEVWERLDGVKLEIPYGITNDGHKLFISDWGLQGIYSYDATTGRTTLVAKVGEPMGLLYTVVSGTLPAEDPCIQAACPDVCLTTSPGRAQCACSSDDSNVKAAFGGCVEPENFVLIADMNEIRLVSQSPADSHLYTVINGNRYGASFSALVWDYSRNVFYFSDVNRRVIYQGFLDGTYSLFYDAGDVIDDLVLAENALYWTAQIEGAIYRLDNPRSNASAIVTGLNMPKALVYGRGYPKDVLYWTEVGSRPAVKKVRVDGTEMMELWTSDATKPQNLFLDPQNQWVGFTTPRNASIYTCQIDEANFYRNYGCYENSSLPKLTGNAPSLMRVGEYMYYSDWDKGAIMRATWRSNSSMVTPGLTGAAESSTTPVVTGLVRPTNFVVVTRNNDNANDMCGSNHMCSDICVSLPLDYVCTCSMGRLLSSDGRRCYDSVSRSSSTFRSTSFASSTVSGLPEDSTASPIKTTHTGMVTNETTTTTTTTTPTKLNTTSMPTSGVTSMLPSKSSTESTLSLLISTIMSSTESSFTTKMPPTGSSTPSMPLSSDSTTGQKASNVMGSTISTKSTMPEIVNTTSSPLSTTPLVQTLPMSSSTIRTGTDASPSAVMTNTSFAPPQSTVNTTLRSSASTSSTAMPATEPTRPATPVDSSTGASSSLASTRSMPVTVSSTEASSTPSVVSRSSESTTSSTISRTTRSTTAFLNVTPTQTDPPLPSITDTTRMLTASTRITPSQPTINTTVSSSVSESISNGTTNTTSQSQTPSPSTSSRNESAPIPLLTTIVMSKSTFTQVPDTISSSTTFRTISPTTAKATLTPNPSTTTSTTKSTAKPTTTTIKSTTTTPKPTTNTPKLTTITTITTTKPIPPTPKPTTAAPTTTTLKPTTTTTTPTTTTKPTTTTIKPTTTNTTPTTTTTTPTTTTPKPTTTTPIPTTSTPIPTTTTKQTTTTTTPTTTTTTPTPTTTTPTPTTPKPTTTTSKPTTTTKPTTTPKPTTTTTTPIPTTPKPTTTTPKPTTTTTITKTSKLTTTTPKPTTTTKSTTTQPTTIPTTVLTTTTSRRPEPVPDIAFINCPRNRTALLERGGTNVAVWWLEPEAVDKKGSIVSDVTRNKDPGALFGEGLSFVTYEARDSEGNTAECTFFVTVKSQDFSCKEAPSPLNGDLVCSTREFVYTCEVECQPGYVLNPAMASVRPACRTTGWSPDFPPDYVSLSCLKQIPLQQTQPVILTYSGRCESGLTDHFKRAFVTKLTWQLRTAGLCPTNPEKSGDDLGLCAPTSYQLQCETGVGLRKRRQVERIKVNVTLSTPASDPDGDLRLRQTRSNLERLLVTERLNVEVDGQQYLAQQVAPPGAVLQGCPPGHVVSQKTCLLCPAGSTVSEAGVCEACSAGSYQPRAGAASCLSCPGDTVTDPGAFSPDQCVTLTTTQPTLVASRTSNSLSVPIVIGLCVAAGLVFFITIALAVYTVRRLVRTKGQMKLDQEKAVLNGNGVRYVNPAFVARPREETAGSKDSIPRHVAITKVPGGSDTASVYSGASTLPVQYRRLPNGQVVRVVAIPASATNTATKVRVPPVKSRKYEMRHPSARATPTAAMLRADAEISPPQGMYRKYQAPGWQGLSEADKLNQ